MSLRANPLSKSNASVKPVNRPENIADWHITNTNWKAVYPAGKVNPGTLPSADSPPAKLAKNPRGKIGEGNPRSGRRMEVCIPRHAPVNPPRHRPPWLGVATRGPGR